MIPIVKRKYWYRLTVDYCVVCGRENKRKERVTNEKNKGIYFEEDLCGTCFNL